MDICIIRIIDNPALCFAKEQKEQYCSQPIIADLHVFVIWLQLPEFLSFFLSYLNFEFPVGFK